MPPVISAEKCLRCGQCADICPLEVFGCQQGKNKLPTVLYPDECWHCNVCALDCPAGAITLRHPISHMILHVDSPFLQSSDKGCRHAAD